MKNIINKICSVIGLTKEWINTHFMDFFPLLAKILIILCRNRAKQKTLEIDFESVYIEVFFLNVLLLHGCIDTVVQNEEESKAQGRRRGCMLLMLISFLFYVVLTLDDMGAFKDNYLDLELFRIMSVVFVIPSVLISFASLAFTRQKCTMT